MFYYFGIASFGIIILKSIISYFISVKPISKIDIRGNTNNFKIDLYKSHNDPDFDDFRVKYKNLLNTNYFIFRFDNLKKNLINDKHQTYEFELLTKFVNFVMNFGNKDKDKILIIISSPGGYAFEFEEAHTQLSRLKYNGFDTTAIIDKICASGGYMLACACNQIICSETSMIGSIGVIGQSYNFKDLADKIGIKFFEWKTGNYKGGFPTSTEYTEEDNNRMKDEINKTFMLFKHIIKSSRPFIDLKKVTNAKVFYGREALRLKLVDKIQILDDYLLEIEKEQRGNILYFNTENKKNNSILSLLNGFLESMDLNKIKYWFSKKLEY